MLIGTNLEYAKAYNVRIVLETIRLYGPVSRADIARRTELTAQTITNIVRRLIGAGLVYETEKQRDGRGAPSTLLVLNPEGAFSIGLDLDKDHLTGILVDFTGNVRQRMHYELNFPSPDEAMDLLERTARALIKREGISERLISGVGVGLPGPLDIKKDKLVTNVANPSAFPGWNDVPVADILNQRLELTVFLEKNATAAAIGERWYGEGRHINTFFYVFFGAGLGGGLIMNGQPFDGHTGNAGELGFFPTTEVEEQVQPFTRPHLGIYFNLPRLYRLLQKSGTPVSRPDDLQVLFEQNNECLLAWLDTAARHLAPLILAIDYLIDPQAIFFGGRLPAPIIKALMKRLEEILPTIRVQSKATLPLLLYATSGADAAALGVATLPMYTMFAPVPGLLMKRSGKSSAPAPLSLVN